ncbi:blastula protease 10-like [Pollicipes pollicipes]|uniref:blastula protease 10-like n=1 Tax=Pollicipes pollicipes TaxID=41117 RepID=UPI001884910A|nr:blastula protease 10-like [Pollicipes pollicipes]
MSRLLMVSLLAVAAAAPSSVSPQNEALFTEEIPEPQYLFENHNPDVTDSGLELFESDMVLTEEQKLDRKAAPNLWPGGQVKYAITSTSVPDRAAIEAALNHWHQHTCVTFTEVSASFAGEPHLRFSKQSGCWSYVGRIGWTSGQDVSIGTGCTGLGTIAHEVGHALGFNHEQSRPDRNNYVTILTGNIQDGRSGNFAIASNANNYSVPYDYTSVMHYGSTYFTKNGQPTIQVNQLQYSGLIGSRTGLSHRDKQLANAMYSCAASCSSPPACQNGGYVSKACSCVCPPGTSGSRCQTVTAPYYGSICGNQAITSAGTVSSINWPSIYPRNQNCFWIVTAPAGRRVRITFNTAKVLYRYSDGNCYWDWINLYTNSDNSADVNACGSELQGKTYTTTGNRLALEMHTYAGGSYPSLQTGFTASVSFV